MAGNRTCSFPSLSWTWQVLWTTHFLPVPFFFPLLYNKIWYVIGRKRKKDFWFQQERFHPFPLRRPNPINFASWANASDVKKDVELEGLSSSQQCQLEWWLVNVSEIILDKQEGWSCYKDPKNRDSYHFEQKILYLPYHETIAHVWTVVERRCLNFSFISTRWQRHQNKTVLAYNFNQGGNHCITTKAKVIFRRVAAGAIRNDIWKVEREISLIYIHIVRNSRPACLPVVAWSKITQSCVTISQKLDSCGGSVVDNNRPFQQQ